MCKLKYSPKNNRKTLESQKWIGCDVCENRWYHYKCAEIIIGEEPETCSCDFCRRTLELTEDDLQYLQLDEHKTLSV